MQENRVNKSIRGEGIYEKRDNNDEQTHCNNNIYDANHNPLSPNESQWYELSLNENKFDLILDALEQQVETLNKLHQRSIKLLSNENSDSNSHSNHYIKNLKQSPQENLNPSISDRKSFLEDYVRTNISKDQNCTCHFEFSSNELKLLDELNECYRKFCQFSSDRFSVYAGPLKHREGSEQQTAAQQVIEEASNFIGCERESRRKGAKCSGNHSCFIDGLHASDHPERPPSADLQKRRPSNKPKGSDELHLFIEAGSPPLDCRNHPQQSEASCRQRRKGGQLRHAKSDSELHFPSGNRIAERGERLVSGEACSESALYDNPFGCSVELHPFGRPSSASIFDSDRAHESSYTESDGSESSANQSSPEYEQRSALIGIEEWPICDSNGTQRSFNECKRKHRSSRSHAKRYKQRTSSSSLDGSLSSDYQLGCSLTYESLDSPSPRQLSPSDQSTNYYWASSDDFDSISARNSTRASYHPDYSTFERKRHQFRRQVDDAPSEGLENSSFIAAENYHSIESCASYEIEKSGTSQQPWIELPDERRASASSRLECRGNPCRDRLAKIRERRTRHSALNACVQFEPLSSPLLSDSSASQLAETMESNGPSNHDDRNGSPHNLREAGQLKAQLAKNLSSSLETKLKPDTSEYLTIRDHDDARFLRLGTNAKTRLQQPGVGIQHEHLRARRSSESSRRAPISANMKTATNIAKVSLPALASLQYLPGQMDVCGSRSIDRYAANRRASSPHKIDQVRRSTIMTRQIETPTKEGFISGTTPPSAHSRDDESGKQNDSCLFYRLCLCTCLARNCSTVKKLKNRSLVAELAEDGAKMSPSRSHESTPSTRWRARERDHKRAEPADEQASGNSSLSSETNLNSRESTGLAMRDGTRLSGLSVSANRLAHDEELSANKREKQSPSFMNLLQPRQQQAHLELNCKTKKYVDSQVVAQRNKQSHRGAVLSPPKINSTTLGSIGDLAASGRSSASDSHKSDYLSPTDFTEYKSSMASRSSLAARDDGCHLKVATDTQTAKSPSPRTDLKQGNHHSKRLTTYQKLLSPRKLFSSSSSSVCECCEQRDQEHHQPSFFSRSLSRLSTRKRRTSSSSSHRNQPAEGAWPRSPSCTSPTVSVSNSQPDTYSDSINSLDEINLTHSLPFNVNEEVLGENYYSKHFALLDRVPDIVLSRVEYQDLNSTSSRSITRSPSSQQHYRPSSAHSMRKDEHSFTSHQSHINASELSLNVGNTRSAFHDSRRPSSLPGSPNSQRRNHNRSSRLNQSPVPFQSPAAEKRLAHAELISRDETSPNVDLVSDDANPSSGIVEATFTRRKARNGPNLKIPGGKQKNKKRTDSGKPQSKKVKLIEKNAIVKRANNLIKGEATPDDDGNLPYVKRLWNKLIRASRMSLSFNMILLICLAGICVVPLIQRDACCELSQSFIPNGEITVNHKPT